MLWYEYFHTLTNLEAYSQLENHGCLSKRISLTYETTIVFIYLISYLATGRVRRFMKHSIIFETIIQGSNLETYLKGLHHKNVNQSVNSNSQQ